MEVAKMDEYISKQAFKEKCLCCGWLPEMSKKEFDDFPAADVVEVRRGRWSSNGIALVCSECGRAFGIVEMFAHYCPWCGSRMDKED